MTGRLNPSRETKFSSAYGGRGIFIFPIQLNTSRIGNLTRLIHTLLYVMTIHAYSGEIPQNIIAIHLSEYHERMGSYLRNKVVSDRTILPPVLFVIHRLQDLAWKQRILLCVSFIDLTKTYDSVGQTLLWRVLARFCVPQNTISVIRQSCDGMRACVRLNDEVCSEEFVMNSVFIKGACSRHLRGDYKRDLQAFQGKQRHHKYLVLVHLRKKPWAAGAGGSNQRRASPGDDPLGHALR